jgi:hypothetical protein
MVCANTRDRTATISGENLRMMSRGLTKACHIKSHCDILKLRPEARYGRLEQQDCSILDWTSAANGALVVRPEAPKRRLRTGPRGWLTSAGLRWCDDGVVYLGGPNAQST